MNLIRHRHSLWVRCAAIVVFATGLIAAAPFLRAQDSKCAPEIAVTFELRDLRHASRYQTPEIATIEAGVRSALVTALNRRYLHLRFTEAAQACTLQCVFNTGTRIDDPRQTVLKSDAVSWHFRLRGPALPDPSVSWEYQGLDAYLNPIPGAEQLLSDFSHFLGEAAGSDAGEKTEADNRFAKLFDGVLKRVPILRGRAVQHIASTRLLVIPSPRRDFHCSLPDLSEFEVTVDLKDGALSQPHDFVAQLIGAGKVAELGNVLGAQWKDALVTEVIMTRNDTNEGHLAQLGAGEAHQVESDLFLWRPGVADFSCLSTSAAEFDPASGTN